MELELRRTHHDRRLYALESVGTVRLSGLASRTGIAETGGESWRIGRRGFWRRDIVAADESGTEVGAFEPRSLRRGGTLRWAGRELMLRPSSAWRERYALADGEKELAVLDGKSWGRRPVKVTIDDAQSLDPGLLLFAAFVVKGLAADAGATAAAGASVVTTGGG
jgi:hypothetical protein